MDEHISIWQRSAEIPRRAALTGDLEADALIIGGGMAGILTAYQLKKRGVRCAVIEAARVGDGQTGQTTAKITAQHDLIYAALSKRFGTKRAAHYAQANTLAIAEYARIIENERIECGFRRAPAYLYAASDAAPLRREAEAAAALGLDAHFTAETELPFPVAGAVRFDAQAAFNPLKFLSALCGGLEIYENTRALTVDGNMVCTSHGRIRARHIVFATHFPFVNMPGWYFMRLHQERSYVLALESRWLPEGLYLGVEPDGLSFREAEGLLLLGGGAHRTGENSAGGKYAALGKRAAKILPGSREAAHWSAQDCATPDGAPYIGRFSPSTPEWYVATGFGKWGMTSSMAAAMLISGLICGEAPEWADAFAPERFALSKSAAALAANTMQAAKGLARSLLAIPQSTLDALPRGHGGIVEADGKKAGVYKDQEGRCHIVGHRCPHLGCQLEWNPDELSWDCPCHGSRFSYDGSLIDNPAQEALEYRLVEP